MAMGGLRDLSLITTPPAERLAVKTFVLEWNETIVREAVTREIRRGGQIYFVHNTIETIEKTAQAIRELVPEASVAVGHGQMRERDLEQLMLDFYHRRFNVLVCTTIIESGIDVPTANTIIIDRADRFGLAQIHQLRGRVGRSHHRAYAYLITPPRKAMTADAVKRLEALESLEELGAGFTLATHDLEIRGAGELLGDEQSGQIQEIGYNLYMELLERAVAGSEGGQAGGPGEARWMRGPRWSCTCRRSFPRITCRTCTCVWCCTSAIAGRRIARGARRAEGRADRPLRAAAAVRPVAVPHGADQAARRGARHPQDRRRGHRRLLHFRRGQQDRYRAGAEADPDPPEGLSPRRSAEASLHPRRPYRGEFVHSASR